MKLTIKNKKKLKKLYKEKGSIGGQEHLLRTQTLSIRILKTKQKTNRDIYIKTDFFGEKIPLINFIEAMPLAIDYFLTLGEKSK